MGQRPEDEEGMGDYMGPSREPRPKPRPSPGRSVRRPERSEPDRARRPSPKRHAQPEPTPRKKKKRGEGGLDTFVGCLFGLAFLAMVYFAVRSVVRWIW